MKITLVFADAAGTLHNPPCLLHLLLERTCILQYLFRFVPFQLLCFPYSLVQSPLISLIFSPPTLGPQVLTVRDTWTVSRVFSEIDLPLSPPRVQFFQNSQATPSPLFYIP